MQTEIISYVSLGIAVFGAALSLFNTWRAFSNDRVKIRVKPCWAMFDNGSECLLVEVVNLSTFPVTVTHIGFTLRGTQRHIQLMPNIIRSEDRLPKRLEPRTNLTVFAAPKATEDPSFAYADMAYVKTACGLTIKGGKKELAAALHNLSLARKNS